MLGYIEGAIVALWDKTCIIKTSSGEGYEIGLTAPGFASMPAIGENCALFISLVTREDALELYGFKSLEEKRAFEILTSISKIGAKTAMAILSVFEPQDLRMIADNGDYQQLTRVSGIGGKTAQHIFLELKYKISSLGKRPAGRSAPPVPSILGDASAALANLGYGEEESALACRRILGEEPDLDLGGVIRKALKKLAEGKI